MGPSAQTFPPASVPRRLFRLLSARLPDSLVLLRRLQFVGSAGDGGGSSGHAHVVFVAVGDVLGEAGGSERVEGQDGETDGQGVLGRTDELDTPWMAAYLDFGRGPDTQMWMYSTFEDGVVKAAPGPPNEHGQKTRQGKEQSHEREKTEGMQHEQHAAQLDALIAEITRLRALYLPGREYYPGSLLLGSLHSATRRLLEDKRPARVRGRPTGRYDKWLFRLGEMPGSAAPEGAGVAGGAAADDAEADGDEGTKDGSEKKRSEKEAGRRDGAGQASKGARKERWPRGWYWDRATRQDCDVAVSRTDIPRDAEMLSRLASCVMKLADGTPVAWAFLGPDASLMSLHCEPPYRGRGIATALAARLYQSGTPRYGDDGWCSADVGPDNAGSRRLCASLGGRPSWQVSWILLDVRDEAELDA